MPVFLLSVLLMGFAVPLVRAETQPTPSPAESPYEQLQLIARTIQLIRQDYVDE